MKFKFSRCKVFILSVCFAVSCSGCAPSYGGSEESPVGSSPSESSMLDQNTNSAASPLEAFKEYMPSASIYDYAFCDTNQDGKEDCVILYSLDESEIQYATALAVFNTDAACSGITIDPENHFVFGSEVEVSSENGITHIIFCLKDPGKGSRYRYEIEYTITDGTDENYKIDSYKLSDD